MLGLFLFMEPISNTKSWLCLLLRTSSQVAHFPAPCAHHNNIMNGFYDNNIMDKLLGNSYLNKLIIYLYSALSPFFSSSCGIVLGWSVVRSGRYSQNDKSCKRRPCKGSISYFLESLSIELFKEIIQTHFCTLKVYSECHFFAKSIKSRNLAFSSML